MSQPLPPKPGEKDDPGPPLQSTDELLAYFAGAGKPRERFRVGTEHEKFGFLRETTEPLPFDGERGIEAILEAIAADEEDIAAHGEWTVVQEAGRTIALTREGSSITLEPGGQLELSGAPLATVHETCDETGDHLRLLKRVCLPKGVGFIGIGFHPTASYDDFPTVPKSRYGIMRRYMPTMGGRGLDMMKRTCTVQANFDFLDEADMVRSFRASIGVAPLVTALFANSPFVDGKPSGRLSERSFVWTDTDPDRSGYPACVFADGFGYEAYLDWVLDVPMYFVRRDGLYLDYAGASFRTFMAEGLDEHRATLRDFEDHLTCVFPEVRLKRYLEVRSADCGPWSRICALPALYKGILYDDEARAAAWSLMDDPAPAELASLQRDVAIHGFGASFRGRSVREMCEALLAISRAGLERIALATHIKSEAGFLAPLERQVDKGETFAEWLLGLYKDAWGGSLDGLWDELEFYADRRRAPRP